MISYKGEKSEFVQKLDKVFNSAHNGIEKGNHFRYTFKYKDTTYHANLHSNGTVQCQPASNEVEKLIADTLKVNDKKVVDNKQKKIDNKKAVFSSKSLFNVSINQDKDNSIVIIYNNERYVKEQKQSKRGKK